jgi:hypothetical protein
MWSIRFREYAVVYEDIKESDSMSWMSYVFIKILR